MGRYIVDRSKDGDWYVYDRKTSREIAWFLDDQHASLFAQLLNKEEPDNVR